MAASNDDWTRCKHENSEEWAGLFLRAVTLAREARAHPYPPQSYDKGSELLRRQIRGEHLACVPACSFRIPEPLPVTVIRPPRKISYLASNEFSNIDLKPNLIAAR